MKNIIFILVLVLLTFSYALGVPTPNEGPKPYPYDDHPYQGNYGIWYRENHDNTLKKPLLIVSGFDPSSRMRIYGYEENGDKYASGKGSVNGKGDKLVYLYDIANKNSFLDNLRKRGYDVIAYRCVNSRENTIFIN